jgi:hypothetical protein
MISDPTSNLLSSSYIEHLLDSVGEPPARRIVDEAEAARILTA